ncbi:fibrinogen C domain-containing protein 1-A-like [Mercenaria mercenaria]|uniref:fibrinogen C domain-containing protein 1-A-like n=1 Tax=Mercenaria mercenaria TaxID=6596 RepID=UPI00234EB930|nr:fibrinogen C domain-containing protein 1-A-like [Mercenaria mercenaria]
MTKCRMDQNVMLFALFIKLITASDSEQIGNHVININSCCSDQRTDVKCNVDNERLFSNLSEILNGHQRELKEIFRALNTESKPRDCQDIQHLGNEITGVYMIYPEGTMGFQVRCDMDTAGGGWTVLQKRISYSDFSQDWYDYQIGFGNLSGNFWLGNQQIHKITGQGWYELRVDLESMYSIIAYAQYNVFSVGDVNSGYKLTVDGYSGNAGDSLSYHNSQKFSTKDKDNDKSTGNCAVIHMGGWWYNACDQVNLNGKYGATDETGPEWTLFRPKDDPLKVTEMKIRRWTSNT